MELPRSYETLIKAESIRSNIETKQQVVRRISKRRLLKQALDGQVKETKRKNDKLREEEIEHARAMAIDVAKYQETQVKLSKEQRAQALASQRELTLQLARVRNKKEAMQKVRKKEQEEVVLRREKELHLQRIQRSNNLLEAQKEREKVRFENECLKLEQKEKKKLEAKLDNELALAYARKMEAAERERKDFFKKLRQKSNKNIINYEEKIKAVAEEKAKKEKLNIEKYTAELALKHKRVEKEKKLKERKILEEINKFNLDQIRMKEELCKSNLKQQKERSLDIKSNQQAIIKAERRKLLQVKAAQKKYNKELRFQMEQQSCSKSFSSSQTYMNPIEVKINNQNFNDIEEDENLKNTIVNQIYKTDLRRRKKPNRATIKASYYD